MSYFTVLRVPYVNQLSPVAGITRREADFACGPACAAMVAAYYGGEAPALGRALTLAGGRSIVGRGVMPWQLAQLVRSLTPVVQSDASQAWSAVAALSLVGRELGLRRPLVALVKPSWVATAINHYVVVTGIDARGERLVINDPLAGPSVWVPWRTFAKAWHDVRWVRPFSYVWTAW